VERLLQEKPPYSPERKGEESLRTFTSSCANTAYKKLSRGVQQKEETRGELKIHTLTTRISLCTRKERAKEPEKKKKRRENVIRSEIDQKRSVGGSGETWIGPNSLAVHFKKGRI